MSLRGGGEQLDEALVGGRAVACVDDGEPHGRKLVAAGDGAPDLAGKARPVGTTWAPAADGGNAAADDALADSRRCVLAERGDDEHRGQADDVGHALEVEVRRGVERLLRAVDRADVEQGLVDLHRHGALAIGREIDVAPRGIGHERSRRGPGEQYPAGQRAETAGHYFWFPTKTTATPPMIIAPPTIVAKLRWVSRKNSQAKKATKTG